MVTPELALRNWATSGAMALTGSPSGPPMAAPGHAATAVRRAVAKVTNRPLPGLLGERAAYAGLRRNAPWSCGGKFRILHTSDGHLGLALPRDDDLMMIPALIEDTIDPADPWRSVEQWARVTSSADALARVRLLELAGGIVPTSPPADRDPVIIQARGSGRPTKAPLVVDLSNLWAGPLCAHLLGLAGAHVVKVESARRPDGARLGSPDFFELLHRGHTKLALDFDTELSQLFALIAQADIVIEASRSRALRRLGIIAEDVVASGTSWLSITARGRDSDSIGFGDDIAVEAGLFAQLDEEVIAVGDALADPLTGATAAAHAAAALASEEARLIDVSMLHVAAAAAHGEIAEHEVLSLGGAWWVEAERGRFPIVEPHKRQ